MSTTGSAPLQVHADNPAALLQHAFAMIADGRMAGLPICNPALTVAVPAMRLHEDIWIGVLVTPWTIALAVLPHSANRFRPIEVGQQQCWTFASGDYVFMGNHEPGLGHYQTCSLFSPVFEFADQATAEATACAALDALLTEPARAPAAPHNPAETARFSGTPLGDQAMDRRRFLRGGLFGARG